MYDELAFIFSYDWIRFIGLLHIDCRKEDHGWDEFLMTQLSEATARWIIAHQIQPGEEQDKLESLVDTYHGPTEAKPELIQDNISEDGDKKEEKRAVRQWKKGDET